MNGASKLSVEVEGLSLVHLSLPHDRRAARLVGGDEQCVRFS